MTQLTASQIFVQIGNRQLLKSVTARFEPGQVTAIVGPNGAGKSTFMDCLTQLRRPDQGQITLDGVNLRLMPARQRARKLAYLPQNAEIAWDVDGETFVGLGRTAYKGAWGMTKADRTHVARAMALTGTDVFAERVVSSLSGGERARVLIARALAGDPQWLLADEPLAGLDPGHVLDVCDLFRQLAHSQGCGVILTLHDLDAALRVADRVLVLTGGQIIADDHPHNALTPAVLSRAYGIEAQLIQGAGGPVLEIIGRGA